MLTLTRVSFHASHLLLYENVKDHDIRDGSLIGLYVNITRAPLLHHLHYVL